MSGLAPASSSPAYDPDQNISPLLASYQQTVVASTVSGIKHESSNIAVAKHNGIWNRGQTIGAGRFGEVFLSKKSIAIGRELRAVKEIVSGRKDWVDREMECMIVLKNFSELFVGIQCWYRYSGRTFIAMDYYSLGDLTRQIITSEPFEESVARDIAEQILHAVFVLHKHNLVHRDIKPQNIVIASISPIRIRLADFGIARDLSGPSLIGDDSGLGTADWAAPEQLDQYTAPYTNKVDMWPVGCVVYYLLTSLNPFSDRDADYDPAVIARHQYPFWPRLLRRNFYHTDSRSPGHAITVRGVSAAANRFLRALIVRDPRARLSAFEALQHPWINPTGMRPVGLALIRGNEPLSELLRNHDPEANPSPTFILRVAAVHGHLRLVQHALRHCDTTGTAVFESDIADEMPGLPTEPALVGAARNGHVEVVKLLLAELDYPTVRERERVFRPALEWALRGGHAKVVDLVYPLVSDVYRVYSTELNVLIACFGTPAFLDCVYLYLHGKTTFTETDSTLDSFTPGQPASSLHIESMLLAAARSGATTSIKVLVYRAFNHRLPIYIATSMLLSAASAGQLTIVEPITTILRSYTDGPNGFPTALTAAAQHGHIAVVRFFLKVLVAPDITALDAAAVNNHTAVFRLLVSALLQIHGYSAAQIIGRVGVAAIPHCGVNLLAAHPNRESLSVALEVYVGAAARLGHLDVVRWLLGNVPGRGNGLLDAVQEGLVGAAERGQGDVVEWLCRWGGSESGSRRVNVTRALKRAAMGGYMDVVEMLLACGATGEAVGAAMRVAGVAGQLGVEIRLGMVPGVVI